MVKIPESFVPWVEGVKEEVKREVNRKLKIIYIDGCRYNERLNPESGGSRRASHTLGCAVKHTVCLFIINQ